MLFKQKSGSAAPSSSTQEEEKKKNEDDFSGNASPGDSAYAIWEKEGYSLSPKRQVSRLLAILTLEKVGIERLSQDRRWLEWYALFSF